MTATGAVPRILVVEDAPETAHMVARQLAHLGFEVAGIAGAGAHALALAEATRPDLALMDIHLDGPMDGIAAAAALRSRFEIPVVFLTGRDDDRTLAAAGGVEAFGYLVKPYRERELRTAIAIALYKHAAERERRLLAEQVRRAEQLEAIGRLASGIAHDFNNLLTTILTNAGSLLDHLPPGERPHRQAELIQAAAERAARMTSRLVTFARQDLTPPAPLDVAEAVAAHAPLLAAQLGAHIGLTVAVSPDLGAVRVHRAELEQVLQNLIGNARDAMPEGGAVAIRAEAGPGGNEVVIEVTDTGAGMTPEVARRALEPFFTTKAVGLGAGLGLATVDAIVGRAGGRIAITSQLGQGTTFTIHLPAAAPAPAVAHADAAGAGHHT